MVKIWVCGDGVLRLNQKCVCESFRFLRLGEKWLGRKRQEGESQRREVRESGKEIINKWK